MSDSIQLVPAAPRHQTPVAQPSRKTSQELAQPTRALSRITPYRTIDLPGGEVLREFWKIGCSPSRSMRSALNDKDVARQCAFITVSSDRRSFKIGFFPNGGPGQVMKDLPISQLPQAVDELIDSGFAGTRRAAATETLAISV